MLASIFFVIVFGCLGLVCWLGAFVLISMVFGFSTDYSWNKPESYAALFFFLVGCFLFYEVYVFSPFEINLKKKGEYSHVR